MHNEYLKRTLSYNENLLDSYFIVKIDNNNIFCTYCDNTIYMI